MGVRIPPPLPLPDARAECGLGVGRRSGSGRDIRAAGGRFPPPLPGADGARRTRGRQGGGRRPERLGMTFLTRAREFFREVVAEFRRVNWPSRQELINSTAVVLVVTLVLSFFLGAVDITLARIVERVLR
ncbi:MAG: preprotein translocase subunit SecE [Candidatus Rokuibacteriota bacterium]|nr:MAG: preprotein translocase subunit SecE [Candidatus Rokubacteria bacterium]